MSDDFDQDDDLAWLRGDEDDEPSDDEEQFDWQEKEPGSPSAPPGGHLGFTTELPWMGDKADESGAAADDEDDYTWLQAADAPEEPAGEDFELDWLLQKDEPEPKPPQEQPGWLKRATSELQAVQPEDVPEWLSRPEDDAEAVEPEPETEVTDEEIAAGPDWLQAAAPSEEAVDINEVPDWLQGVEEPPRRPASMVDDTGQLSSEWLASGAELPESMESEQTFDEWFVEQAERERVPDLEEQVPDLGDLASPEDVNPEAVDTGALPDWFLGMEELDVEDAPDWFTGDRPPTDQLDDSPIHEWLAAQEQAEAEDEDLEPQAPEPALPESGLGDDFFANLDDETGFEQSPLDADFFGSLGSESQNTLDDIFAALG
ncbi:MAG: hypothetical protein K8J31_11660, partial [Anaerolineae bacterium]|nr:hypothetical protein [Anaerolineae bacterium]